MNDSSHLAGAVAEKSKHTQVLRDIRTSWHSTPALYSAIDANTYDGAPDSNCPQGFGKTEEAAIQDLLDQLED